MIIIELYEIFDKSFRAHNKKQQVKFSCKLSNWKIFPIYDSEKENIQKIDGSTSRKNFNFVKKDFINFKLTELSIF